MIKVDKNVVQCEGNLPDLSCDIMVFLKSLEEETNKDEFHIFKQIIIYGIFQTFCTDEEIIDIIEDYQKFDDFRKVLGLR